MAVRTVANPSAGLTRTEKILATAGIMLALLLATLDQTIVGTALPRIVSELNGFDRYTWLVTGYLVSSTVITPIAGKLGDQFGRKPFLLTGMIGFVAASALCGLAQDMTQLIVFRIVQGGFGGVLFASAFTTLADIFPPEQRAKMQGLFGAVFGISAIVGPLLGGFITDNWGWRWVFEVNIPVGIAGVAVVALFLPFVRSRHSSWRDIDFIGSVTLAAGLIPLLIALSTAREKGWTSPQVTGLIAFSVVVLVAFFFIEQRAKEPIVPFALFKIPAFTVSVTVGFITAVGMFGAIIFVPLELQGVLSASVTNSGLQLTPMMAGLILSSVAAGQIMVRVKWYRFLGTLGALVMAFGLFGLAGTTINSHQSDITKDMILIGIGLGVSFPLYINAVQSALPQKYLGVGTSQIQFWRNMGGTISSAVLGSILAQRLPIAIADETGRLKLPAGFKPSGALSGSNPNALLDPNALAAARAKLPVQAMPLFDQFLHAVRVGLASSLQEIFLIAAAIALVAAVVSLFMPYVELRKGMRPSFGAEEAPIPAGATPEPA